MLHKWEAMTGLPEGSLVYEKEVRKEKAYYESSKDRGTKRNTQKTEEKRDGRNN